ncbi:hypothetical protein HDU87_000806 [Geranomyces variabilis]|uniref:Uncharacterized protein n=1 Tax=Geranomyces variabilis TaxID=109894 RepID=A0AAD5TN93_9FUNG|nr:hypothetical protein HDU87_000806 [Geranomyces variabilis]
MQALSTQRVCEVVKPVGDAEDQDFFRIVDVVGTNDEYLDRIMAELAEFTDNEQTDVDLQSDVFSDDLFTEATLSPRGTSYLDQVDQELDFAREDDAHNLSPNYLAHSAKDAVRLPLGSDGLKVQTRQISGIPELDQLAFDFDFDVHIKDEPTKPADVQHQPDFRRKDSLSSTMTDLDHFGRELVSRNDTKDKDQQYVEVLDDLDALLGLGTTTAMSPGLSPAVVSHPAWDTQSPLEREWQSNVDKEANAQAQSPGQIHHHYHHHHHVHNYAQPEEASAITSLALELIRLQKQQQAQIFEQWKLLPRNFGQQHRPPGARSQYSPAVPADRVIATPAQSVRRSRAPLPRATNGQAYQNPDALIAIVDQVLRGPPSHALGTMDAALRQLEVQLDRMGLGDKARQQMKEWQQRMECGARREPAEPEGEPDREWESDAPRKLRRHSDEDEHLRGDAHFDSYGR